MNDTFYNPDYSFTIELVTMEDKRIIQAVTNNSIKYVCIGFLIIMVIIATALLLLGLSKEDLMADLLSILILFSIFLLIVAIIFLHTKIALANMYKIVENGVITKQEIEIDDLGQTICSYIGTKIFGFMPSNIKVGDRISIEHTLNKKMKKKLFIRVKKL